MSLLLYFFFFTGQEFIYLGFYIAFNTVQVISRRVVGRAEETSTYSLSGFCTVNCRPTASNYQLSHLRPCREPNPDLRGGRRECYYSATMAPDQKFRWCIVSFMMHEHSNYHDYGINFVLKDMFCKTYFKFYRLQVEYITKCR